MKHSKVRGAYCLGIFQNGNDPTTLLGGILFTNNILPIHDLPYELKTRYLIVLGLAHIAPKV